jgi:hypothetical protein
MWMRANYDGIVQEIGDGKQVNWPRLPSAAILQEDVSNASMWRSVRRRTALPMVRRANRSADQIAIPQRQLHGEPFSHTKATRSHRTVHLCGCEVLTLRRWLQAASLQQSELLLWHLDDSLAWSGGSGDRCADADAATD